MTSPARAVRQTLVLENFPQPHVARALSPNGRAHWTVRKRANDAVQLHVEVMATMDGLRAMRGLVHMSPTFIYPTARRRDDDNLATGVLKSVRDALVRGGWLEADDLEHLHQERVQVRVEKYRRALILEFEAAE